MILPIGNLLATFLGAGALGITAGAAIGDLYRTLNRPAEPSAGTVQSTAQTEREAVQKREREDLERRLKMLDTEAAQLIGRQVRRKPLRSLRLGRLIDEELENGGFNTY